MSDATTRRALLIAAGAAALAVPARAASLPRVVVVTRQPRTAPVFAALEDELKRLGHSNGGDFVFDPVIGPPEALAAPLAQAVGRGGRIIVATGTEANLKAALARGRGAAIVVIAIDYDPAAKHYVASLAHPGGRVTGVMLRQTELASKRLDILRQAIPEVRRGLLLWDKDSADQAEATRKTAAAIGLPTRDIEFRVRPYDYDAALAKAEPAAGDVLIGMTSGVFFADRARMAAAALRRSLPSVWTFRQWVDAGGLLSYGANLLDMIRLSAHYVDKLLKGAKPADLPIQQPTRFELVINLKAAKALGLKIPRPVLARADDVIE